MRSRGLVVAIAVVLAVAAAAAVILYTQGVQEEAEGKANLETVLVSSQTIEANQRLDPLIDQGIFEEIKVPNEALVDGAVTDISQLKGATTKATVFANEQIPVNRLSTSKTSLNPLGVTEGHIGVTVELEAPQGGAGNIQPGDAVAVFATYQNVQAVAGTPAQLRQAVSNPSSVSQVGAKVPLPDFTVTLIPTVNVLKIDNPEVDQETGEQNNNERVSVTLDLLPEDAQNLVFAQENARVWLGVLHPDNAGAGFQPRAATVPLDLLLGARLG